MDNPSESRFSFTPSPINPPATSNNREETVAAGNVQAAEKTRKEFRLAGNNGAKFEAIFLKLPIIP